MSEENPQLEELLHAEIATFRRKRQNTNALTDALAEIKRLRSLVNELGAAEVDTPPDPEKWDDIEAAGYEFAELVTCYGDSMQFTFMESDGETPVWAAEKTIADALNSIRRQVGIPERK